MARLGISLLVAALAAAVVGLLTPDLTADATTGRVVIDFEGLGEGSLVSEVDSARGTSGDAFTGVVRVTGWRAFDPGTQRAMIFDGTCLPGGTPRSCTGQDDDLFFPDRGNILIVSEDLDGSDPDDATDGSFSIDFTDVGPVTIESIGILDTNFQISTIDLTLDTGGVVTHRVRGVGDGRGQDVGIAVSGVERLDIDLGGLGAIDDIVFTFDVAPPTTTTSSTTTTVPGSTTTTTVPGTTSPSGDLELVVWIDGVPVGSGAGPNVTAGAVGTITYQVTNHHQDKAYALYLKQDDLGEIACPDDDLDPGETVTCETTITFLEGPVTRLATAKAWPVSTELVATAPVAYTGQVSAQFTNVAIGGVATQASGGSWGSGTPPHLAVDGNRDGDVNGGSVAMTYRVVGPWWEVDLGANYEIDHISLWNRTDCCGDRLRQFHVFVSDVPFQVFDVEGTQTQPGVLDVYHHDSVGERVDLPIDRTGRYVRVQLDYQDAVLQLAEVEVMVEDTTPVPPPPVPLLELSVEQTAAVVEVGESIDFSYSVTNTGELRLWAVYVRHDDQGAADCPDGALLPGETAVCTFTLTPTQPGTWSDVVTAKAWDDVGDLAVDVSGVEYLVVDGSGSGSAIDLMVRLDGAPAPPPGPSVPFASTLEWSYVVTNIGTANLWSTYLKHGSDVVQCPERDLAVGESVECVRTSSAAAGSVVEEVVVSAWDSAGDKVTDIETVGYETEVPPESRSMAMIASVDGDDAQTPPGPVVEEGEPIPLEFTVTNTGTMSLYGLWVSVPGFGTAICPDRDMVGGETVTCSISDPAQPGHFAGDARAVAYDGAGEQIETFDRFHFFVPSTSGADVHLEVLVDGLNGDQHAGPRIAFGQTMTFSYLITNQGAVGLDDVELSDTDHGDVGCPIDSIVPGVMLVCTVTEVADTLHYTHFDSTVTAAGGGGSVSDFERLYYHIRNEGREEQMVLEVTINGIDADSPPGPALQVGNTAQINYVLTNASAETAVYSATISDPRVPASQMSCSGGPFLQRFQSMYCSATITVEAGDWANIVSGYAWGQNGARIDTSDRLHYTGVL